MYDFRLQDLVARTEKNKLVADLMDLDRVRSLLKTISYRRRFLVHLEKKRAEKYEKGTPSFTATPKDINGFLIDIPSIVVEDMPGTPPMSSRDISSAGYDHHFPGSPTPADPRYSSTDYPLGVDMSGSGLQRSSRRTSDYSTYSTDMFKSPCASFFSLFILTKLSILSFYRRTSLVDDDTQAQDVVTAMQSSVWGGWDYCFSYSQDKSLILFFSCADLMMEVAEEERGNRSF